MKLPNIRVYPLVLVLSAICIVEAIITILYNSLSYIWEKVPVLIVILIVPLSIVSSFIFLWLTKPGYLYPPSEFGDANLDTKLSAYGCESTRKMMVKVLEDGDKEKWLKLFDLLTALNKDQLVNIMELGCLEEKDINPQNK